MNPVLRSLSLGLALAFPSAQAMAQTGSGCAPSGAPPHLSLRDVQGAPTLFLVGGQPLGRAVFLADDHHYPEMGYVRPSAPGCASGARGRVLRTVQLDAQGAVELSVGAHALRARPTVSALVFPPGGALADASLTNAVRLGPLFQAAASLPATGGGAPTDARIVITEFMKDPSAVPDGDGEWIELYNAGDASVDIEGWVLSDLGSNSQALLNGGQGIVVPAGGYLVLGNEGDPAVNGGVVVDFVLTGTTLSNGDDEIILSLADGTLVDAVHYDAGASWPDEAGRSASLQNGAFDALQNDDPANWCSSVTPVSPGSPDTGTPGLANDLCP